MESLEPEPPALPPDRPRAPTVRSRLMLEVAAELVGRGDWAAKQALVTLRRQGADGWDVALFGSDSPAAVDEVLAGRVQFAIVNPACAVPRGAPLAAIATVPSYDQLAFAVSARFGVSSLAEVRDRRLPLRVSLRAQRDHAVHRVVADTLAAAGFSLADLEAWGGQLVYAEGLPHHPDRWAAVAGGAVDAVFDEGVYNWVEPAVAAGMAVLDVGPAELAALEAAGYRRAVLRRSRFPALPRDVATVDFSGFLIYTRADTPEHLVRAFCEALHDRRDTIAWQGGPSLPLERMCGGALDAPVPIPLHPAARSVWLERGMIDR
ncbi:hypothetical protein ABZS66_31315 [Dactylosporangium sp. NPDC005572]|uniref:hypothetical protein n=1 Tax=Dactylosporangium sp. NPDC005572 TaxID=3156889 RepID=UPI0033A9037B